MTVEEKFLQKHKPLSKEEVDKKLKDAESARTKYTRDISEVENNLTSFMSKEDPVVDPATGKIIMWVKQLSMGELKKYTDKYQDAIKGMSEDEAIKRLSEPDMEMLNYEMMAEIITVPKHDASWWKEHATQDLIKLYESALNDISTRLSGEVRFF